MAKGRRTADKMRIGPNSKFARALDNPDDPIIGSYRQSDIARELKRYKGAVSSAAKALKVSKRTMEKYIMKSKVLKDIVCEIVETEIDEVESELFKQIEKGNMTAILFYLKCKGRDRGWIEKNDLSIDVKPITFKYSLAKGGRMPPRGRPKKQQSSSPGIAVTDVFMQNKETKVPVVVNRGGARSSKSYSIIQLLTERFFSLPGRQILMLRKTLPSLRKSTYRDFTSYLDSLRLYDRVKEAKMEMCFTYGKSIIQFGCLDDPSKIKSTQWNDIFMEEATEFTYEDFIILRTRMSAPLHKALKGKGFIPNQLFMAFNPEDENHWLKDKLIEKYGDEDLKEIISNYKDNPFLSEDYIKVLTDLEKDNPNYFRIYGLGEWGKLDHVIYSNWDVIDRFPLNCEEIIYGLDFGFNNPSALVKVGIKDGEIYEEEKIYQSGLTNSDLIVAMNSVISSEHKRNSFVFCDSAEPDRISEISDAGFNVVPADKSIKDGIDMVKRFKTHIVRGSDNLLKEKRSYSWKVDRKTEKILDDPIKFNNHAVDAERYAVHTFFKEYGVGPMVRFL